MRQTNFMKLATMTEDQVAEFLATYCNDELMNKIHFCSKGMCPKFDECQESDECINDISDKEVIKLWLEKEAE